MTRGNQRDLARAKNLKKQQELKKAQGSSGKDGNQVGMSMENRMARDAEAMRIKQQKAAEKKAAEDAAKSNEPKVAKVDPLKM